MLSALYHGLRLAFAPPSATCGTTKALTAVVRSPRLTALPAYLATPSHRSVPKHVMAPEHRYYHQFARVQSSCRLRLNPAGSSRSPRRIGFVILRTNSSLPVALHPASQRRSYLQLQGPGLPSHGLPPCSCGAITGARSTLTLRPGYAVPRPPHPVARVQRSATRAPVMAPHQHGGSPCRGRPGP